MLVLLGNKFASGLNNVDVELAVSAIRGGDQGVLVDLQDNDEIIDKSVVKVIEGMNW